LQRLKRHLDALDTTQEKLVRKTTSTLVILVGLLGLGVPPAEAGVTCKVAPSWCPPPPGGQNGDTSVPEPATLAVLAAGACVAGLAARRRNKKK
jgi:hypothetical protein